MEVKEPITDYQTLDINGSYTYWDYMRWQFSERLELIRGKIFPMSPGPNVRHQRVLGNLHLIIGPLYKHKKCNVFIAPFDVRLPIPSAKKDTTVVQPDLCIICNPKKIDEQGCDGTPDLIVEILSPGNSKHDTATKFDLYEESGVQEYWMIDPVDRLILIYSLVEGKFIGHKPFTIGQQLISPLFSEINFSVDELFEDLD
jgi:Uma2 family endonuclease